MEFLIKFQKRTVWDIDAALSRVVSEIRKIVHSDSAQLKGEVLFALMADMNKMNDYDEVQRYIQFFYDNVKERYVEYGDYFIKWLNLTDDMKKFNRYTGIDPIVYLQIRHAAVSKIDYLREMYTLNRVAVWGAGERGRAAAIAFENYNIVVECIVDNSKQKQGMNFNGIRICSFESIEEINIVVLASK